jgi:hypothetical protein
MSFVNFNFVQAPRLLLPGFSLIALSINKFILTLYIEFIFKKYTQSIYFFVTDENKFAPYLR